MINKQKFIINMLQQGLTSYSFPSSLNVLRNYINSSNNLKEIEFFGTIYNTLFIYSYIDNEFREKKHK